MASDQKRLGADPNCARQEYLKQYLMACVRDSVLSWGDLASPDVLNKLLKIISKDTKAVIADLGRAAGGNLLSRIGSSLANIAEDVVAGRRR